MLSKLYAYWKPVAAEEATVTSNEKKDERLPTEQTEKKADTPRMENIMIPEEQTRRRVDFVEAGESSTTAVAEVVELETLLRKEFHFDLTVEERIDMRIKQKILQRHVLQKKRAAAALNQQAFIDSMSRAEEISEEVSSAKREETVTHTKDETANVEQSADQFGEGAADSKICLSSAIDHVFTAVNDSAEIVADITETKDLGKNLDLLKYEIQDVQIMDGISTLVERDVTDIKTDLLNAKDMSLAKCDPPNFKGYLDIDNDAATEIEDVKETNDAVISEKHIRKIDIEEKEGAVDKVATDAAATGF